VANFILSYDLNGPNPSHKEVDDLLAGLGATRGRVLETVWYVGWSGSCQDLCEAVNAIMSPNDQLLVIEGTEMWFRNLLITDEGIQGAWAENA
jgi:hypothetical protein